MTIGQCLMLADLVSLLSSLYFLSLRNLIIFSISHSFPSSVLKSPWILCFFLLSVHWGQTCRQCFIVNLWFPQAAFLHVGCYSFIDIKGQWINLVFPIHILLSLTSYCLQLLYAFSHSLMRGLMKFSLLVLTCPFPLPFRVPSLPDGQVLVCIGQSCCGYPWYSHCLFCCFVCFFVSFTSYVRRNFTQCKQQSFTPYMYYFYFSWFYDSMHNHVQVQNFKEDLFKYFKTIRLYIMKKTAINFNVHIKKIQNFFTRKYHKSFS